MYCGVRTNTFIEPTSARDSLDDLDAGGSRCPLTATRLPLQIDAALRPTRRYGVITSLERGLARRSARDQRCRQHAAAGQQILRIECVRLSEVITIPAAVFVTVGGRLDPRVELDVLARDRSDRRRSSASCSVSGCAGKRSLGFQALFRSSENQY